MADEIIKLLEYITGNSLVQGIGIAYIAIAAIAILTILLIAVVWGIYVLSFIKRWKR